MVPDRARQPVWPSLSPARKISVLLAAPGHKQGVRHWVGPADVEWDTSSLEETRAANDHQAHGVAFHLERNDALREAEKRVIDQEIICKLCNVTEWFYNGYHDLQELQNCSGHTTMPDEGAMDGDDEASACADSEQRKI